MSSVSWIGALCTSDVFGFVSWCECVCTHMTKSKIWVSQCRFKKKKKRWNAQPPFSLHLSLMASHSSTLHGQKVLFQFNSCKMLFPQPTACKRIIIIAVITGIMQKRFVMRHFDCNLTSFLLLPTPVCPCTDEQSLWVTQDHCEELMECFKEKKMD